MKTLVEINTRRAQISARVQEITSAAGGAPEKLTAEQETELAGLHAEYGTLGTERDTLERRKSLMAALPVDQGLGNGATPAVPSKATVVDILPKGALAGLAKKVYGDDRELAKLGGMYCAALMGSPVAQGWLKENGNAGWTYRAAEPAGGALAALNLGDNTAGGYLVPEDLEARIINLKEERGTFARNARNVPMRGKTRSIPRRTAGITAYHVGSNLSSGVTQSAPTYDRVDLQLRDTATLSLWDKSLEDDAVVDLGAELLDEAAYAFANREDADGWNGTGSGTYGGHLGLTHLFAQSAYAGGVVTATSQTSFGAVTQAYLDAVVAKLPVFPGLNPKWYISSAGFYAMMNRLMNAGGGNKKVDLSGAAIKEFMGYPVEFVQVLPTTLATNSAAIVAFFGDMQFSSAYGYKRNSMMFRVLRERYADQLQDALLGWSRFTINNHDIGDASNAGPLVALKLG